MLSSLPPSAALVTSHPDVADIRETLDAAAIGDRDALGRLFHSHGRQVYRSAFRITRSRADAEDVTQDVFVRLPAMLGGFVRDVGSFDGWLRRVAIRQALMQMRSGRRRRETSVDGVLELVSAPGSASSVVLDRMTLDGALERLSPEHRTVFLLREVEGYGHAEIAELLEISVANSEVRLHRARRQLRELLRGSR